MQVHLGLALVLITNFVIEQRADNLPGKTTMFITFVSMKLLSIHQSNAEASTSVCARLFTFSANKFQSNDVLFFCTFVEHYCKGAPSEWNISRDTYSG